MCPRKRGGAAAGFGVSQQETAGRLLLRQPIRLATEVASEEGNHASLQPQGTETALSRTVEQQARLDEVLNNPEFDLDDADNGEEESSDDDFAVDRTLSGLFSTRQGTPGERRGSAAAAAAAGKPELHLQIQNHSTPTPPGERARGRERAGVRRSVDASNKSDKSRSPLQASVLKARGKDYHLWAVSLLQRACTHRGIQRMLQQKTEDEAKEEGFAVRR